MTVSIRQEINILNETLEINVGTSTGEFPSDDSPWINIDVSEYNGESYYLEAWIDEIVLIGGGAHVFNLFDESDVICGTITVAGDNPLRSTAMSLTGDKNYRLGYKKQLSGGQYTLYVREARIVIEQSAASITDTKSHIEVGAGILEIPASINTWEPIAEPKYWKYESAKWDPAPTFTLQVCMGCEDDKETYQVGLEHDSGTGTWSGTVVATITGISTEAPTFYESSSFTPVNGYKYRLVFRGDDDKDDIYFDHAKVVAKQSDGSGISKFQTEYLGIKEYTYLTNFTHKLMLWDPADWDGVDNTYWHEHSANAIGSNTKLYAINEVYDFFDSGAVELPLYGGSGTYEQLGQSFTTPNDGQNIVVPYLGLKLLRYGDPDGVVYIVIATSIGGSAITNGQSEPIDCTEITDVQADEIFFEFAFPVLSPNTKYYFRLVRSSSRDTENYVIWRRTNSDIHSAGGYYVKDSGSWGSEQSYELQSRIYNSAEVANSNITGIGLVRSSSALTMPSQARRINTLIITA